MLGRYLADTYLQSAPRCHIAAFQAGCAEPDYNPTTYLKGSIRSQWLRGHNWESSQKYMNRLAHRLEKRKKFRLLDFYTIGKLIHYTTDAFTFAHNTSFSENLRSHVHYEQLLHTHMLEYLKAPEATRFCMNGDIMHSIYTLHSEYAALCGDIRTDARFCVGVSCAVLNALTAEPLPQAAM